MSDILTTYAATHPDKISVIDDRPGGEVLTLTYAELEARSNQLANVLLDLGVRPNTKVVWCGQNSIGVVAIINAARKIGCDRGAAQLPAERRGGRLRHRPQRCGRWSTSTPSSRRCSSASGPSSRSVSTYLVYDGAAPAGMIAGDELVAAAVAEEPAVPATTEAGATMIYTSGTTGKPKGALRRGVADPVQLGAMLQLIGYTPDDVYITTGPLYHSGPGGFMGVALALGQTIVLQRKFDPEDWMRLVDTYRVHVDVRARRRRSG